MGKYLSYSGLSTFLDLLKTTLRGHTIKNSAGADMTQRTNLQFTGGVSVSDDSTNDRTIIDISGGDAESMIADLFDPNITYNINDAVRYDDGTNTKLYKFISDDYDKGWNAKIWSGLTSLGGYDIWTDGENIYYSYDSDQYILDETTSTWSVKTWNGLTSFRGRYIWTDGNNTYYSFGSNQYVLDKTTSTWNSKAWNGYTSLLRSGIWTDGDNIYYSGDSDQYILDKTTSTWSAKTWNGLTSFYGFYIWTDGDNTYYSSNSNQYVLDKTTSTWSAKTWSGLTSFSGRNIWTDGDDIYYSGGSDQYILDKVTSTWSAKTWNEYMSFYAESIWADGENTYCSSDLDQYILSPITTWNPSLVEEVTVEKLINDADSGHTIQDKSGTDLADQSTLQFAGYQNVTNDSTNGKTIVDNSPITIPWADYQALTSEQRQGNHYILTNIPSGGGSVGGGHVIEDDSGVAMPQEENLQFVGVYTEDDATNGKTKVNIVRPMTKEQYEALTPAQKKGFIHTTDEPDNPYQKVSASDVMLSDNETDIQEAIDDLRNAFSRNVSVTNPCNQTIKPYAITDPATTGKNAVSYDMAIQNSHLYIRAYDNNGDVIGWFSVTLTPVS